MSTAARQRGDRQRPVRTTPVRTGRWRLSGRPAARRTLRRVATCSSCGTVSEDDHPPITWSLAVERGRTQLFCGDCSRRHLRAMEAKLDSEWW